ncbi:MAG: hypothetical protein NC907_03500 [Candidatus Omnitrophica bacterium]|nr:hypothetical protein [Candidatus Omnitrophota bacterium]
MNNKKPVKGFAKNTEKFRVSLLCLLKIPTIIAITAVLAALLTGAESADISKISQTQIRVPEFAIGVEYIIPGFAEVYAKTGVKWAKPMGKGFSWDDIEPYPPVNGKHKYHWEEIDRLILEYQKAGFHNFHIYVKSMNRWASSRPIKPIASGSSLPKPEYIEDYKSYLRALVQRYDTNNPDHAPGLLYPIEYWEIEAEWGTGFWQGTLEEYLELLKIAYPTIKQANPRAKVILIGFFLAGLFEGDPDPKEMPATLAGMPAKRRHTTEKYLSEIRQLLAHPELFDIVEFHSLSDWSEISGMARFLRQTMRQYGYEKPIWVGDVNYTASPMMFWGEPVPPYTYSQKSSIETTLKALSQSNHPKHDVAIRWLRAEQAKGLVKKVVLAMAEGLAGINIGNMADVDLFAFVPTITGTAAFQGLIDTVGIPARPGAARPAYHALCLVVQKLADFSEVIQLDLGKGIYAYKFIVRQQPVYVLWYDDGKRYLPGEKEPSTTVYLPLVQGKYLLVETPISQSYSLNSSKNRIETKTGSNACQFLNRIVSPSAGGYLNLTLTTRPIFLHPYRE